MENNIIKDDDDDDDDPLDQDGADHKCHRLIIYNKPKDGLHRKHRTKDEDNRSVTYSVKGTQLGAIRNNAHTHNTTDC